MSLEGQNLDKNIRETNIINNEITKETTPANVFSDEKKLVIEKEKIQKEEENNNNIEKIRNDILKQTEVKNENNRENILSPQRKEELIIIFNKLKEILEEKNISQEVKDLLQNGDVLGAITGIKPASYIQPHIEKKFLGILKEREGLSSKDLQQFEEILKKFDIDFSINNGGNDPKNIKEIKDFKKQHGIEIIHIFNQKKVLDTMKSSNLFSEEEINLAERDMGNFLNSYLSKSNNMDWDKVYRVGVLYGYPLEDVKSAIADSVLVEKYKKLGLSEENVNLALEKENSEVLLKIEKNDLEILRKRKNHKGVNIKGIKNGIYWGSFNPELPEVQNKIKEMQEVLDTAKEVLT